MNVTKSGWSTSHRGKQRYLWLGAPVGKWERSEGDWERVLADPGNWPAEGFTARLDAYCQPSGTQDGPARYYSPGS